MARPPVVPPLNLGFLEKTSELEIASELKITSEHEFFQQSNMTTLQAKLKSKGKNNIQSINIENIIFAITTFPGSIVPIYPRVMLANVCREISKCKNLRSLTLGNITYFMEGRQESDYVKIMSDLLPLDKLQEIEVNYTLFNHNIPSESFESFCKKTAKRGSCLPGKNKNLRKLTINNFSTFPQQFEDLRRGFSYLASGAANFSELVLSDVAMYQENFVELMTILPNGLKVSLESCVFSAKECEETINKTRSDLGKMPITIEQQAWVSSIKPLSGEALEGEEKSKSERSY